jgi:hypothetical protein
LCGPFAGQYRGIAVGGRKSDFVGTAGTSIIADGRVWG